MTSMSWWGLAAAYGLLIVPFAVILWHGVPIASRAAVAIARMTVQLLFVGFYLQAVFDLRNPWVNVAWVLVMVGVADGSILKGCAMRWRDFALPMFVSLLAGLAVPLLYFLWAILRVGGGEPSPDRLLPARYVIPIGGMILGNCMRADIVGVRSFLDSVRKGEKAYLLALAQGARLREALAPHLRHAIESALAPTLATTATIGLVSLPGMMTGVMLGGADPSVAIRFQIAIMIAILSGTSITVAMALWFAARRGFDGYGAPVAAFFRKKPGKS